MGLHIPSKVYSVEGSVITIRDEITVNIHSTFPDARKTEIMQSDPSSPDYVDADECRNAMLSKLQADWLGRSLGERGFLAARLFRDVVDHLHNKLPSLKHFDNFRQAILVWWIFRYVALELSPTFMLHRLLAYIASGQLYPHGDCVFDPVKEYQVHILSGITPEDELKLLESTFKKGSSDETDIATLKTAAKTPSEEIVVPLVAWAQSTMKKSLSAKRGEKGWISLFKDLPEYSPASSTPTGEQ